MWILFSSCMSPLLCGLFLARDRQDKPHLQGMIENDTWEIKYSLYATDLLLWVWISPGLQPSGREGGFTVEFTTYSRFIIEFYPSLCPHGCLVWVGC